MKKIIKELKKELIGKEIRLQDMEEKFYFREFVYRTDIIYEKEVLEEEDLAYTIIPEEENRYSCLYPDHLLVTIEFTEKNEDEPWNSYVVVKDIDTM